MAERLPDPHNLADIASALAKNVLSHCFVPSPQVVQAFNGPVFPSVRDQKNRVNLGEINGRKVFLDDNTTPRWAMLWCHGFLQTNHPKGWTFAHVWPTVKDPDAYTHLANLVMMPEALASLSDKNGPLCRYLRYHAQTVYGWTPNGYADEVMPDGFESIAWTYFDPYPEPKTVVAERLLSLDNQRTRILCPLMKLR